MTPSLCFAPGRLPSLQQLTLSPVRAEAAAVRPQFSSGSDDSGDDSDDSAVTPADLSQDSEDTTDSEPGEGEAETVANNGRTHGKPVSPSAEEGPSALLSSEKDFERAMTATAAVGAEEGAAAAAADEPGRDADEPGAAAAMDEKTGDGEEEEDDDDDGEECFAGDDTGPIGSEELERVAQDLLVDPPAGVASRIGRAALDGVVSAAEQEADLRLVARAGAALLQRAGKAEQVPAFLVRVIAGLPRCEEVR